MNICAKFDYELSDKQLNKIYLSIFDNLDKKNRKNLKSAEFAWIKYRDAHCEAATNVYELGSMAPLARYSCLNMITKQRIDALNNSYPNELRESKTPEK